MIVATVLKSGGIYDKRHVHRINEMAYRFIPHDKFVCLTDMEVDCESIPLQHGFTGWWSKMEMFKMQGPVLYLDLDTIVCKEMSDIIEKAKGKDFIILRDFYRKGDAMQSSMMYWSGDMSYLYDGFVKTRNTNYPGDQEYIEEHIKGEVTRWQDITDGVVSFKVDVQKRGLKDSDKCVIFHGNPRPWEQDVVTY